MEAAMCLFSGYPEGSSFRSVEKVSGTNIFARSSNGNGRQILVYSMNLASRIDLAMILPLPVPAGSAEDAVQFISLKDYPEFFHDMEAGFFDEDDLLDSDFDLCLADTAAPPMLEVHDVGDFEASYVPTMNDWDRLDERFRIPASIFDALPLYRDFGFAVFKLKATPSQSWLDFLSLNSSSQEIHPMAFEFPRADPDQLFFPTVHIHDGRFHPTARFDHTLYCQIKPSGPGWRRSAGPARSFLQADKANGVIEPDTHCYRKPIQGKQKNEDILVRDRS
jgi:hypothetical protein